MNILLIYYSIIVIVIIYLLVYHLKRLHLYKLAIKFPGPQPVLPIIGNALYFFGSEDDLLNKVIALSPDLRPIRFWFGPKLFIVLHKPDHVKNILLSPKCVNKSETFRFYEPWLGTGLFTAPAEKWKVHRKLISPAFNPRILESFIDIILTQTNILIKKLDAEVDREEFEFLPYMSLCTLDIICETAMGVSLQAQNNKDSFSVYAMKKAFEIPCIRILKIWLQPDIIFYKTKLGKLQNKCIEFLHKQTHDILLKKKKSNLSDTLKDNPTKWKPFLDLMMELSDKNKKLTDQELCEEVDTMVAGGNDTTATANTFVVFMLANFPEIQEKCYEELREILGDRINDESPIINEDLSRMEYLERVIKETLRIFPLVPVLVRHVTEDLDIGDYVVPSGCTAAISIINLHRSEAIWEDPLEFNPDRFLLEKNAERHPYAYIPFSAGPRNCIGLNYAMMSMKLILGSLLCKYKFKKDRIVKTKDIAISFGGLIRTVDPITVKIERRPKKFV
ncbi:cytochrome P450 4C1-like [Chelonus insularis]|uniref:cytochrome P450 4C1-like n=1 Tax=Chelonus insularis TaxID=460826 RepID=UPI00158C14FC|nr:cytochrome P450 4C1-like [Chelonus insularis]